LEKKNKGNKGKQRRKPQSRESMLIGVWIEEQVSVYFRRILVAVLGDWLWVICVVDAWQLW
jgi:hypothetical protein